METNRFDYFGRSKIMEFGFHMWVKPVARMLAEFPEKQKEYGLDTHNNGAVNHFHSKRNGTTHKQRKEKRYLPRSGSSLEYLLSRMKTFSISKVFKLAAIFRNPDFKQRPLSVKEDKVEAVERVYFFPKSIINHTFESLSTHHQVTTLWFSIVLISILRTFSDGLKPEIKLWTLGSAQSRK